MDPLGEKKVEVPMDDKLDLEKGRLEVPREHDCDSSISDLEISKLAPLKSTLTATSFRKLERQRSQELQRKVTEGAEDYERDLSFRPVARVDVKVRNLSLSVALNSGFAAMFSRRSDQNKVVKILDGIDADMPSGQLTALIGASGSGKTSMLNVISDRMTGSSMTKSGSITFNDKPGSGNITTAYVIQQDILIPTLTVRETLHYAAQLRLPSSISRQERDEIVESIILELGLKDCANTRIGDNEHKGCSGGERRRTSIGVQLLSNPSVLYLDEPTTGLDAATAHQLMITLKNLAKKGRTIITTIHQPRSEIWNLFDRVILLSRGQPVYCGTQANALPYFSSLGYELPEHFNPADYLIDTSAIDSRTPEAETLSLQRVDGLVASWKDLSKSYFTDDEKPIQKSNENSEVEARTKNSASFMQKLMVQTSRCWVTTLRDPYGMAGSLFEAISLAVVAGWIYYLPDGSLLGIRSRVGSIYSAAALQGYLVMLYETWRLSVVDINVFDREKAEGVATISTFLLGRRLAKFLLEDLPVPLLFSAIYYFMVGLERDAERFFIFFSVILIGQFVAVTFATLAVAISRNFAEASLIANFNFTLQSLACGYFLQASQMPVYVRWTKWISYVYYMFVAMTNNELKDNFYDCPTGGRDDRSCIEYHGNFVLDSFNLPRDGWIWKSILIALTFVFFFYTLAGITLNILTVEVNVSRRRTSREDVSTGKERMESGPSNDITKLDVVLNDYMLGLRKKSFYGRTTLDIEILKGVTAKFEAGTLNVIMGPSGSGKSSLLNSMAQRLHNSLTTRYRQSGEMLFNGSKVSDNVVKSLCSYVTQDDDALLPSLTVRETLHFAAGLRLPKWMSKKEKKRRAEDILLKMGLKDCADTVVGSEFVKGISGGEKRRVSIAVQVLTEPRVLLLDEPTSGLDAFTASSILEVLQGLANEGRTVICTIHQSRSDLFNHFGNVLLLARGGNVVYSGASIDMLHYFQSLGFTCPTHTNPADFALDLVTVNLQHEKREKRDREKVKSLIDSFKRTSTLYTDHRTITLPAELGRLQREQAPLLVSLPVLVERSLINIWRQPHLVFARIMQVVGLGIILALFFAPLKNDFTSVQTRLGYINEILPVYFVGLLQNAALYPYERDVFYREYADRAYSLEAFILSYTTNEIPFELFSGLTFSAFAVMAVGLNRTVKMYFAVSYNVFCIVNAGESLGIIFNTFFDASTGFAINVCSTMLSLGMFMAGLMSYNIPTFLSAMNHLSPLKYSVGNLLPYSLEGQHFSCEDYQKLPGGRCPVENGKDVLNIYGYHYDSKKNLVYLAVVTVAYRIVAYLVLKAKKTSWGR
ncbi:hypothetical protein H072_167 [Dactylellina haptotyla CBS 200.50]|uniref:ABC transporter domain-containing protein n=1 Tax=Dactylellina haptotyla (strain CBS 200.50) TaxID=1284197 RepID=S8C232_DACHA|nr:hypothetical protein H072_167 [Dactylellina haptotyla CBS 200.50]